MLYFIGWSLFLIFFRTYLNVKVFGRKNVPKKGAFIFVSNHCSYLDPMLLGTSVYRSLNYMARDTLFKTERFARIMRGLHAFPVKREDGDIGAIKESLRILSSGKGLVIFPEGTRSKDGNLQNGKPGAGFFVARSKVPVVPAYIDGSFEAMPGGRDTLKRHPVRVYIGAPMVFEEGLLEKKDRNTYQRISDEIMRRIADIRDEAGCA